MQDFTAAELKRAGFSPAELAAAGFSPKEIAQAGFTPDELRKAGFTAAELRAAGFTPSELKAAGYSDGDIKRAGYDDGALAAAGIDSGTPGGIGAISTVASTGGGVSGDSSLIAAQKRQAALLAQQQYQQQQQQIQTAMAAQANQLFSAWAPPSMSHVTGAPPDEDKDGKGKGKGGNGAAGASGADGTTGAVNLYRAGDIAFAVLDTAVNSDQPGPILATLVSGKMKGAKLIGSLARQDTKVLLSFTTMNSKDFPSSISLTAIAIDPTTARTALSSDTDNHYLLRYGSLFASSFLSGYGQAVSSAGTTVSVGTTGTVTTVQSQLTPIQETFAALGNVGTAFGNQLAPLFNKPPTVRVYSGTSLGILFLSDVAMPTPTDVTT